MKKYLSVMFLLFFAGMLSYGQVPTHSILHRGKEVLPSSRLNASELSRLLQQRVLETFRAARNLQNRHAAVLSWPGPSKSFMGEQPDNVYAQKLTALTLLDPRLLYPMASFLAPEQVPSYFLARHNLELRKWLPKFEAKRQAIWINMPAFEKAKNCINHPQEQDMTWLADQITPDIKYFFVGEEHEAIIGEQLPDLFRALRRNNRKKRKIFLFTEFLLSGQEWQRNKQNVPLHPGKKFLWDSAVREKITVVGLDPSFTYAAEPFLKERSMNEGGRIVPGSSIWGSIEGVRIRNQYWENVLREYRKQYPDALFVIYAGTGHVEYGNPYSLGDRFAGPETFVALLFPEYYLQEGRYATNLTSIFDAWTNGSFLDRVLQFNDRELSRLAGFDARIRIPVRSFL